MVFRWCLNDSKSLQVSKTVFSILTDLNNAVVWIVLNRPPISNSSSHFSSSWELFLTLQLKLVWTSPSYPTVFLILCQVSSIRLFLSFLWFSLCCPTRRPNLLCKKFVFFLLLIPRYGILISIRLSVVFLLFFFKIQENILRLFLYDVFWYHFVVWMNFNFLYISQVDYPSRPVMSRLIFPLLWFTTFTYYMINSFLPITISSTLAILLRIYSAGLRDRRKRDRTPLSPLRSLSDKYLWEKYEPTYPSSCGLNRIAAVLIEGWLWYQNNPRTLVCH